MKKRVLVAENDTRLWEELQTGLKDPEIKDYGTHRVVSSGTVEFYLTRYTEIAQRLIDEMGFGLYFLDNQLDLLAGGKILSQNALAAAISARNGGHDMVYNISTHENWPYQKCDKSAPAILGITGVPNE